VQKAVDPGNGCLRDRSTLRINRAWSAPTCVFAGIDIAFAKRKRLPVTVCFEHARVLQASSGWTRSTDTTVGRGNAATLDAASFLSFAQEVAVYLRDVERHFAVRIQRTGMDAPSRARSDKIKRRRPEVALDSQAARWDPISTKKFTN
jgi:hypothetical protein